MTLVMPSGTWRRGVEDIHKTCEELRSKGAKVVREPGPMKHGGTDIAFSEDPMATKSS
jgi:lactoylglutathione lyase